MGRAMLGLVLAGLLGQSPLLPDLPLVEARAVAPGHTIALVLSGDGNWAESVKEITRALNRAGVSVIGLKSRAYLTSGPTHTPETVTRDVLSILEAYGRAWQADTVLMIGYSRGANLLPFVLNRLPPAWMAKVGLLALISGGRNASFEFHLADLVSSKARPTDLALAPEVDRITGVRVLCVYGSDDENAVCPALRPGTARILVRPGGHHMDKDFEALGAAIVAEWRAR
jgi:type IV secretory pathway VirJ component